MVAQKVGEDSSLQRMIRLVESADADKAEIVGIADRWATWIVVIALLAAGGTWFFTGEVIRAVTVLVVFCPCALVLATPTAIMAGIGDLTKHGILVRQGDALERLATVKRVVFDKTGTLTYGKPEVVTVISCSPGLSQQGLLQIAASAECRSEHPLGKAIAAYAKQQSGAAATQPDAFTLLPGRGVSAQIEGKQVYAGNEALLQEQGIALPASLLQAGEEAKENGSTAIFLSQDGSAIGMIALSDTLRPDAANTIEGIHQAGFKTTLLTGDGAKAANHMAQMAGISDVTANCLPEDKLAMVKSYQAKGEAICMVGDGINDAPALKAARVGVAMGGIGSDIAIEAADIALVGDDIEALPHLLLLSKKTMHTIHINLAASMVLNFVAIALAITGVLNPVVGALVHNIGSVAVILNSSLLLKWGKKNGRFGSVQPVPAGGN